MGRVIFLGVRMGGFRRRRGAEMRIMERTAIAFLGKGGLIFDGELGWVGKNLGESEGGGGKWKRPEKRRGSSAFSG
jgi:hypothetical protein